ncbi:myosin-M heavy chain-like [Harmonia axyridis]|uniref:myosin-M heavy chain-like n=1 Tax=Harmonia axyridis TaxID=115357 RepID=UPI001E276402|nr:myosin-M heavy chain-like [Harmonia axyridis]
MRWVLVILLSLIGIHAQEDESNEVIIAPSSTKSPLNLDTNLRKALLKALVELENEEKSTLQRDVRNDYVNIITHLDSKDRTVEKASASSISFFSRPERVNMTVTVKKSTSKPKQSVVVQRSQGLHKTIYDIEDHKGSDTPEQIITSASNSFASAKSENSKIITGGAQLNSLSRTKTKKNKYEQTTTIRPTSSTEESEANVESLQFFSAPLVAAFTVHQDEKGLPKSVVPIYNQGNVATSTTEKQQEESSRNQEELQREVQKQQKELEARQEDQLKIKQLELEGEIERLKKLREEQENFIREQKILYEQKLVEQQKRLLDEQTRLFNVQSLGSTRPTTTTPTPEFRNNFNDNLRRQPANTLVSIQPSVGFVQPVVSTLPQNAQILPIKNPVDFRTPFPHNFDQFEIHNSLRPLGTSQSFLTRPQSTFVPSISFNPIQNSFVPSIATEQNSLVPIFNTPQNSGVFQSLPSTQITSIFHQAPTLSHNALVATQSLPLATTQTIAFRTPPLHGTRSLRQESGTGNFLNNRYNSQDTSNKFFRDHRFNTNTLSSQQTHTNAQTSQFPRSTFSFNNPNNVNQYQYNTLQYSVDQPSLDQRFNNLLLNAGLGQGRQQENLNIVSKVLSLNHFGTDSQTSNTNNDFKRIRVPPNWRVV